MLSVTRRVLESPKCDKCVRRPGSPSALPDPLAAIGEGVLLLRGREGREERGGEVYEGGRKGEGRDGKGRGLPPLYLTSGYGPDWTRPLSKGFQVHTSL